MFEHMQLLYNASYIEASNSGYQNPQENICH